MTEPLEEYRVKWEIDVDASSPKEAAIKALKTQMDPGSSAVVFDVTGPCGNIIRVDLAENSVTLEPVFYLLVVWDDIEPEIKGPYGSRKERFEIASKIRREKGKDHGLYALNTKNGSASVSVEIFAGLPDVNI